MPIAGSVACITGEMIQEQLCAIMVSVWGKVDPKSGPSIMELQAGECYPLSLPNGSKNRWWWWSSLPVLKCSSPIQLFLSGVAV